MHLYFYRPFSHIIRRNYSYKLSNKLIFLIFTAIDYVNLPITNSIYIMYIYIFTISDQLLVLVV